MQYPDKEEQKRYEQRIARDKTKIKEAIENKNMNILFMLAKEYIEMGYWVEEAELLTKIVELDPNGFYGKQAKKLLEPDDIKLKDDKGIGLTEEADREIKALEKNHWADILSPKKALSLAEAYQRYGLTEEALLRYFEILLNFKKSTEAKAAKIAFDELIKNNNFDPELIKSLEEDLKTKREGIGLKIISLIKTAAKKLLNLTVF